MRQGLRAILRVLAMLLALLAFRSGVSEFAAPADKGDDAPMRDFTKLKRGMTPEQVRQFLDPPKSVARQILYHRYREQWLYEAPFRVGLTFDCPRGRKPQLLTPPRTSDKTEPLP